MSTIFGYRPQMSKGPPPPSIVPRERVYGKPIASKPEMKRRPDRTPTLPPVMVSPFGMEFYLIPIGSRGMAGIIEEVAAKHGYLVTELKSPRRHRGLVLARQEAMWRCKMETNNSFPEIARALGGRDHTTILHGVRRHAERIARVKPE